MPRCNRSFLSGVGVGVLAGLLVGGAGIARSATGKQAWDRFGSMFKTGYITGFLDCVRVAKGMQADGYIASNYVLPPNATPAHFQVWINRAYKDPALATRTLPQMIAAAGPALLTNLPRLAQPKKKTPENKPAHSVAGAPAPADGKIDSVPHDAKAPARGSGAGEPGKAVPATPPASGSGIVAPSEAAPAK